MIKKAKRRMRSRSRPLKKNKFSKQQRTRKRHKRKQSSSHRHSKQFSKLHEGRENYAPEARTLGVLLDFPPSQKANRTGPGP